MYNIKKKYLLLLGVFLLFIFIFPLNKSIKINLGAQANGVDLQAADIQYNNETLTIHQKFQMFESTEDNGTFLNENSVNIDLGTSRWNVSNLAMDISNMTFLNETKIIEDHNTSKQYLHHIHRTALAVQIKIPALTKIYQIKIYANGSTESNSFKLQINGYDSSNHLPNTTRYGEQISLNVSNKPKWCIHKYSNPIELPKGNYSLILNGTGIQGADNEKYYWWYNDNSSTIQHPDLYRWEYDGNWNDRISGEPFLYKLDQQVIEDVHPTGINMTAKINGKNYMIKDKEKKNTGNLSLSGNFFPNSTNLNIIFKNNVSDALIVNGSYQIKLDHILYCSGSVFINQSQDNLWIINTTFHRFGYNYTVIYDYPDNWTITTIHRNDTDVTSNPDIDDTGDLLYFYNNAIPYDSDWEIEAKSMRYNLTIDPVSGTSFDGGENLGFMIKNLPIGGNYTFILVDTNGLEVYNDTKVEPTGEFFFNYSLPLNANTGIWSAYIFWNNNTDAGMQNQSFQITDGDPPLWAYPPSNANITYGSDFSYNVTAYDDQSLIDNFLLSDDLNFNISIVEDLDYNATAEITNTTSLSPGEYLLTIYVNDTQGNTKNATIKISVFDNDPPEWDMIPTNINISFGLDFYFNVTAYDEWFDIDFWLNDLENFSISIVEDWGYNATAEITNTTSLSPGEYPLTIYVNDTQGNTNNVSIIITVFDEDPPNWVTSPKDQSVPYGGTFSYSISARDQWFDIDSIWLSDYNNFKVTIIEDLGQIITAEITNSSQLSHEEYLLTIYVNDTKGNTNNATIKITVYNSGSDSSTFFPPQQTQSNINNSLPIIIILGVVAGVGGASYLGINKIRKDRKLYQKTFKNKAIAILNLKDVIVIAKKSGLNIYEEHYSGRQIDATLVSGFLEAIRSFGVEITGTQKETKLFSLEYQKSIVIMSEYKNFRLIFIMSKKPSKGFLNNINDLSLDIEEKYGEKIKKYSHDIKAFKGIHELIQKHLNTAFISPLQIIESEDMTLDSTEQDILKQAKRFMKENGLDYFFTSFLFSEEDIEPEEVEAIFNLIGRGILNPIKLQSKKI